jgi:hypothetical protein
MIRVLNNFLNLFEAFFYRFCIAFAALIIFPIILTLFILGVFSLEIKKREEDEQ